MPEATRRALVAVLDHDLDEAERLLASAARRDSDAIDTYLSLARLYRLRGEIGRAIQIHQNLLLRTDLDDEQRFGALLGLADDFRQGGFLRRAIAAYEEVLALRPRHPSALRALVSLLADAREARRAVPLARRLARAEGEAPGLAEAGLWVDVAESERAEGRSEEARKALARALRRDKTCVRAWVALGQVEAELGHNKKALAAWKRVPELDRRAGPSIYTRLAATFAALDRARDYETFLNGLIESQPDDPGAHLALARALAARGAVDEAVAEVRSVIERDPEDLEAHGALGRILLESGRDAEAHKAHQSLLELLDHSPRPLEDGLA
ncbi:MAG: tetratricopeptide repeat protein [Myxococcota bacterium]|nr:tetratricopeptide repeat protein [Myxococcota bacterium]